MKRKTPAHLIFILSIISFAASTDVTLLKPAKSGHAEPSLTVDITTKEFKYRIKSLFGIIHTLAPVGGTGCKIDWLIDAGRLPTDNETPYKNISMTNRQSAVRFKKNFCDWYGVIKPRGNATCKYKLFYWENVRGSNLNVCCETKCKASGARNNTSPATRSIIATFSLFGILSLFL